MDEKSRTGGFDQRFPKSLHDRPLLAESRGYGRLQSARSGQTPFQGLTRYMAAR